MLLDIRRLGSITVALVSLVGVVGSAMALPVVLREDLRRVGAYGDSCYEDFETGYNCTHFDNEDVPDTPFQTWITGGQQSSVDSRKMTAEGNGSGASDLGWSSSFSRFDIVFDVTAPTEISLEGELFVERWANAGVSVLRGGDTLYELTHDVDGSVLFSEVLVLPAGRYQIIAGASGTADPYGTYASYSLNVDISPDVVPEPATALLIGLGLAMLGDRRRSVPPR